jgi:hypothetical protein
MLRTLHYPPHFGKTHQEAKPASPPAKPAAGFWLTLTARMICNALPDGRAAYRHYERMRARGVHHDTALREALDVGVSPRRHTK